MNLVLDSGRKSDRTLQNKISAMLMKKIHFTIEEDFFNNILYMSSYDNFGRSRSWDFHCFFNISNSSIVRYGFKIVLNLSFIRFIFTRAFTSVIPSVSEISL